MGIFGTSKKEESELREAAQLNKNDKERRYSLSSGTGSSAYLTAEEDLSSQDETQSEISSPRPFTSEGPGSIAGTIPVHADDDDTIKESGDVSSKLTHKDNESSIEGPASPKAHANYDSHDDVEEYSPKIRPYVDEGEEEGEEEDDDEEEENRLNREYTLERLASHRSIAEIAEEELSRQYSEGQFKQHAPEENIVSVKDLTWDSDTDPANPQNWPLWKKWGITFTVAIICLCCSLGSSLYTGGVPELMIRFGASQELCISGLTFYLIGLALGPVLTAPLSEIIGRRWIYITSLPIAMLFIMGVGLAQNIHTILVLRFFCGYFSSPALSIAGGTIADLWSDKPEELSQSVALFCLAPFLGPVLGPIIGNFAGQYKGWKWAAAWVLLMFCGAIYPFILITPETYKPIILKNRAIKRGMKVEAAKFNLAFVKRIIIYDLFRPVEMLFKEQIVSFMSFYIAFVFAVLFGFFEAYPIIFRGVYHMQPGVSGLPFLGVGIGLVGGVIFYIIMDKVKYFPKNADGTRGKRDENGNFVWDPPERKLLFGKIGAVCLPISLFWLGWTGRNDSVHWMAPAAAGVPFGFGLILVFFSVILYFSMSFPPMSVASAVAANNLLRYLLASVFPLFTVQMYERLHISWASTLFAFIALAMVPVPFVFAWIGPRMRANSPYGYAAYFKKIAAEKAAAAAAAAGAAPQASAPVETGKEHIDDSSGEDTDQSNEKAAATQPSETATTAVQTEQPDVVANKV
ncbi:putative transporter of major facilitator superfamily [Scheffersomyces xylosifermentans]|uniref:putative transporter of major facilitator superfamily n=1 Tax=Scheffersomyces xylosifermentans TaxID=1304137 RepID=UPI00315CACE7